MRSKILTPGAPADVSLAFTIARYRKFHGLLAPFLGAALGGLVIVAFAAEPQQVAVATLVVLPLVFALRHRMSLDPLYGAFLAEIFLWGFLFRAFLGLIVYYFSLHHFFGADSLTYDWYGWELAEEWRGEPGSEYLHRSLLSAPLATANWGILYWTAAFYYVFGENLLLLQFVHSVIGAGTAILVVKIADALFGDREISIVSGLFAAFFPSMALWSGQLMKEPLLIFCLCLIVYSVQQVLIRFRLRYAVYIFAALLAMLTIRFYLFYAMLLTLAVVLIAPPRRFSPLRLIRQLATLGIVLAGVLYVVGAGQMLRAFEKETQLEKIQVGRLDQAVGAEGRQSAFAVDADVSTTQGASRHLPVGFLYFMFGPFPWEVKNLRQTIGLAEGLLWWVLLPVFLRGLWLALRQRLPESWIMLVFTTGLVLMYSLGHGNVGTAYRHRSQVLIFYFIFIALGYVWKKRQRLARVLSRQRRPTPALATDGS